MKDKAKEQHQVLNLFQGLCSVLSTSQRKKGVLNANDVTQFIRVLQGTADCYRLLSDSNSDSEEYPGDVLFEKVISYFDASFPGKLKIHDVAQLHLGHTQLFSFVVIISGLLEFLLQQDWNDIRISVENSDDRCLVKSLARSSDPEDLLQEKLLDLAWMSPVLERRFASKLATAISDGKSGQSEISISFRIGEGTTPLNG